jgi:spore germination protein KB
MYETPAYVFRIVFMAGVVIAMLYGIETIARASEVFIVAATVVFVFSFVLLLRDVMLDYLLPVLESGVAPVLRAPSFCPVILPCPSPRC